MRFLLRLLMLLILSTYVLSHYGLLRDKVWPRSFVSTEELLSRVSAETKDHSPGESVQAALPAGVLPRGELTPRAVDPRVTQQNIKNTICRRGYTVTVRPPFEYTNAMKHRLMRAYGFTGSIHDYELDHLIPLELGGCPSCEANLWPEPRNVFPGANEKDEVERYLHHQVCSGALPLAQAQREIAADWYAVYEKIRKRRQGNSGQESSSEVYACQQQDRSPQLMITKPRDK